MIKQVIWTTCKTVYRYSQSLISRLKVSNMSALCSSECTPIVWSPFDLFDRRKVTPLTLLILNQPIDSWETFTCLWKKAVLKVCVDGGTNHCFQLSTTMNAQEYYIPDVISGDMDSVRPEVIEFYKEKGVDIIKTPDQNATDFTKALKVAVEKLNGNPVTAFVALVRMTGRVDHIFGIINTLHVSNRLLQTTPLYVVSKDSITWLLRSGIHCIELPREAIDTWCGLIPIGEPCRRVFTTGLKWNLRDQSLEFGGIVSTSNTFEDAHVTVRTDGALLFTMGIAGHYVDQSVAQSMI